MLSPSENGVSVEPGAVDARTAELERLLHDDEIIILAVKPSSWFVLLVSLPVLWVLVALACGAYVADHFFGVEIPLKAAALLLSFIALLRITLASFQWLGLLYVLTNRRVIHIRGIVRINLAQCQLKDVRELIPTAAAIERALSVGSLYFSPAYDKAVPIAWIHLADPSQVHQVVEEAIHKARRNSK